MTNDTIADILTRLRNAHLAKHQIAKIPFTKMSKNILNVLLKEGFIADFEEMKDNKEKYLIVSLKYKGTNKQPVITELKRISKPGLRIYANHKEIPKIMGGIGIAIISTSKGLMTDRHARHLGLGGEVICYIW